MRGREGLTEAPQYVLDPLSPFPKRWQDRVGPIRVMTGPIEGYLMVRRPGGMPFCLHVKHLTNAERHPVHGPFAVCTPAARSTLSSALAKEEGSASQERGNG
jgi:hypothetical protein